MKRSVRKTSLKSSLHLICDYHLRFEQKSISAMFVLTYALFLFHRLTQYQ